MSALNVYKGEKKDKRDFERCFWRVRTSPLGFHHIMQQLSHTYSETHLQKCLHRYKKWCMKYSKQCRADSKMSGYHVRVTFWVFTWRLYCLLHYVFLVSMHCELSNKTKADVCCSTYPIFSLLLFFCSSCFHLDKVDKSCSSVFYYRCVCVLQ